jgi:DNA polymerase I-like protein with 3'-5' exonuclease and polymerase domains
MAGAVPEGATPQTHPAERAIYKVCMLAVQYGMGAKALADQLGDITLNAKRLLQAHRDTFSQYWRWSERVQNEGFGAGKLQTRFGWQRNVAATDRPASVRNFPVQGNGAEMLRLALMQMERVGIHVIAPIHDAVLIEAEAEDIHTAVAAAQEAMRWASEQILPGFPLQSDVKIVSWPNRYMDEERGTAFWNLVMSLVGNPAYTHE